MVIGEAEKPALEACVRGVTAVIQTDRPNCYSFLFRKRLDHRGSLM